jgi:glycosyltransferase involved in cell wall biosynthesis
MKIAVVIPLYNGARFIEAALRSVQAQTLQPDEVIVVDDGSTDNGSAIVRRIAQDMPLTLLTQPNGGQSSARNYGIRHASADLIALLDQDDIWYPHHLMKLRGPFLRKRVIPLGWVYSNLDEIDEHGRLVCRSILVPSEHPKRSLVECLRRDLFILPSASLISRAVFESIGGFDERLSGYEDDDLFLRMFRTGYDNVYLDQALSQWRMYATSTSYSARMGRSRLIYAAKMMAEFPDDPRRDLYYVRDLIIPRFQRQICAEWLKAIRECNAAGAYKALDGLELFRGYLMRTARVALFLRPLLLVPRLARLCVTLLLRAWSTLRILRGRSALVIR